MFKLIGGEINTKKKSTFKNLAIPAGLNVSNIIKDQKLNTNSINYMQFLDDKIFGHLITIIDETPKKKSSTKKKTSTKNNKTKKNK